MNPASTNPIELPAKPCCHAGPVAVLTLCVLLWLGVFVQMIFVVPRIERIFLEFKMTLPLATELVFSSGWVGAVGAFVVWCVLAGASAILLRNRCGSVLLTIVLLVLILVPLLSNLFLAVSLYLPYMELLDGLAGGNKK